MLQFAEIKQGKVINFNNFPCVIIKCDFKRMQQSKPTKYCKLRRLDDNSVLEYTFKSGENAEEADLRKEPATFMYLAGSDMSFMLTHNYETVELPIELLGDKTGYLKESLEVTIVYFNDKPISVELPIKISFLVTQADEVAKGNTVNGVMKDATIETGKVVKVPAFIKAGERILVSTVEDEYVERDTGNN